MKREKKHNLFTKFYLGEITTKEEEAFLATQEAEELLLKQWENTEESDNTDVEIDSNKIFNHIQQEIVSTNNNKIPFLRIAAVILVVVSLSITGILIFNPFAKQQLVEYKTTIGERQEINLPDGSKVWLNSNSVIRFNENFKKRIINLSGEAFFDVTKGKGQFKVKTADYTVVVLGTQFTVSNYDLKKQSYTVLKEGLVQINYKNQKENLKPNQKFILNKETNKARIVITDSEPYISWTTNQLKFDNTKFVTIIDQLEKWYGIEIVTDENVDLEKRFTLTVRNETPEEIFALFDEFKACRFERQGNKIIITPQN